jgi:hypothetical protein
VNDANPIGCPAGATNYGSRGRGWAANLVDIPNAAWIWAPNVRGDLPAESRSMYFSRSFSVGQRPTGWIAIAVDDAADIRVDGRVIASIGSDQDVVKAAAAQSQLTRIDLTLFLHPGRNVVTIAARNGPLVGGGPGCSYAENPAGVVFGGAIAVETINPEDRRQQRNRPAALELL